MNTEASTFPVLADFENDGRVILRDLICKSPWKSLEQALASLTAFAHPDVVRAVGSRSVFRTIRGTPRGEINVKASVMLDDNSSPAIAFEWATQFKRGADLICCHLYTASDEPTAYTDVRNIFFAPTFLAKLTDSQKEELPDEHSLKVLRYRAWELFGYGGPLAVAPTKPVGYERLRWASPNGEGATPEAVRASFIKRIARRPKDRIAKAVRSIGWTFSNYAPDDSVSYTGS
jgi:hypothetical protein